MEIKMYTKEFADNLTVKLQTYDISKVDRSLCKKLANRVTAGETLSYLDLDRNTLKDLCIGELCPDGLIAIIFDTSSELVRSLRELYGYTRDEILKAHLAYVTCLMTEELEKELGERAFQVS